MKEMLGGCCVCADENGWEANPLVYCDGPNCEVAVHQGCYGIIEVPEGEWFCAKCTDMLQHLRRNGAGAVDVRDVPRCELCPFGDGALKRTDSRGWAHVICALYIPEVRFGDVHSMDPVIINDVPIERFQQPCYLCSERGEDKRALQGACMSCNKPGCKKGFHVTCAQAEGLLCEEGGGSKNVKYCGYCAAHAKKAIGDPLIKIIPPYRHRAQSSSCSSTTSGGGQQISPRLNSTLNGIPPAHDHFLSRSLLSSISPIGSNVYSNRSASVTPLSGVSSQNAAFVSVLSNDTNRQRDCNAMLLDPIQRTPLPPTSVDRAMINAVLSQPLGAHSMLDGGCSPPVSSGRSSIVHDTPPPTAAALSSSKCDQPSNLEILVSTASIVPLPSNINALITSPLNKTEVSPPLNEKALNNGALSTPSTKSDGATVNSVRIPVETKVTPPIVSVTKAVKRSRNTDVGDRPKRPRNNNKTSKSVKALLESVGPLISETVSDFQRERVFERDALAAAALAAAASAPSTSADTNNLSTIAPSLSNNPLTSIASNTFPTASSLAGLGTSPPFTTSYLPSTSTATSMGLVGLPLLRNVPKVFNAQDTNLPSSSSVDRHHVSSSIPSTSLGLGSSAVQHSPFPQSMEELLERQWEQGSHFLMQHAPFDIAQLLSCLHELKMENVRLEDSMAQLVRRRDHLLALNARLSLSLTTPSASTANTNSSPHHSPRLGTGGVSIPSMSLASCPPSTSTASSIPCTPYPTLPPSIDDSLSQLRSLAGGGLARNGASTSLASSIPSSVLGRPSSRHTPLSTAPTITSIAQSSQTPFSLNRIPCSVSGSGVTPTSLASGKASDLLGTTGLSPERQQQLAAAAVAAATANALGTNFLNNRTPSSISTSSAGGNPLGQFASQELLTQYALLAQHQLLQHQAVAAAALSARYGGLVMPNNATTPPSSQHTTTTTSHSGK